MAFRPTLRVDPDLGQARGEVHQLSGPDDEGWDEACLKYFKSKYRQRLQGSNWANGNVP